MLRDELINSHLNGRPNYASREKERIEREAMARMTSTEIEARALGTGTVSNVVY